MTQDDTMPSDELLTAFIDGELDGEERDRIETLLEHDERVAARLEFLTRANFDYRHAFAPLLGEAPVRRLQAMLDDAAATKPSKAPSGGISRRGLFGAMAASVAAGILAGRTGLDWFGTDEEGGGEWRGLVAQYMSLYDAQTLAGVLPTPAEQAAELADVNRRLDMRMTPAQLDFGDLDYKRAQVLAYEGRPLAQILYLDPESGPLAFCIVRSEGKAEPVRTEQRNGMTVVHWSDGGHGLMLIGHAPETRMLDLADALIDRISA
ncbi:zf-HC2 domain-containing protein [Rhizobium cremeum]|uniref:anti-sigma factor family protein n=1 Tax=Rhizobium cremeum TaxID=2813827 RepID=UPI000DDE763B